ncbi:MAG: hypothetical protein MK008_08360 [Bdellovibrionales bacterium]|nr:hypothetical protein [Bdellovibrionales bacterium]
MKLLLLLFLSFQAYSDNNYLCNIEDGKIAGEKFKLVISEDSKKAYWYDMAENSMYCNQMKSSTINLILKNIKNSQPTTEEDQIYYCIGGGTFSIPVIHPDMTGQFYISKFAFNITCK